MRSHNRHLAIALKPRKRKLSSKDKSSQTFATRGRWPRVTISPSKKPRGECNDTERNSPQFDECSTVIDADEPSNVIACDIVELFCENSDASNEERTACPRISSSTELEEDEEVDVCATCKDCAECQLQQQDSTAANAKIRKASENLINCQDEELAEHLDYYEGDDGVETASTSSTVASIEHEETPILVDLTSEESKQVTWKQSILKRFGEAEESSEMSGENVIMSKGISLKKCRSWTYVEYMFKS